MPKIPRAAGSVEEFNAAVQHLINGKSDRDAGILAGAYLEGLLCQLLQRVTVDSILQSSAELFDYPRPLSSFGNMISMAYAFGIISQSEFINLQLVKNVRNYCAHAPGLTTDQTISFESEAIKKLLREFHPSAVLNRLPQGERERIKREHETFLEKDPRMAFRLAFCHAGVSLSARIAITPPLTPPEEINSSDSD